MTKGNGSRNPRKEDRKWAGEIKGLSISLVDPCLQATCTTSAGATSSLTLVGVGKYPFLAASTTAVDFGEVLSGSIVDCEVIVTNAALVAAAFEVRSVNGGGEERGIRVTPTRGRLLPNERVALRVSICFAALAFSKNL